MEHISAARTMDGGYLATMDGEDVTVELLAADC